MPRSLWFRALIGIWGLWFTSALSELGGLHTCPVHDGKAMAAGAHMMHGAGATHGASASHHEMSQRSSGDDVDHAPAGGHDHGNACSCLGSCCCCAPISGPIANVALIEIAIVASHPLAYAEVPAPNFARTYAQPYPNGPPARV